MVDGLYSTGMTLKPLIFEGISMPESRERLIALDNILYAIVLHELIFFSSRTSPSNPPLSLLSDDLFAYIVKSQIMEQQQDTQEASKVEKYPGRQAVIRQPKNQVHGPWLS